MRCWDRAALDLPPGPRAAGRPERRRQDLADRGRRARVPRRVAAHGARGRGRAPRGAGPARHASTSTARPGAHLREIGFAAGAGAPAAAATGQPVRSLGDWRARAVLVFLPDELRAVKGPPAARRRALDRVLEAASPGLRRGPGRLPARPGPAQRAAAAGAGGRRPREDSLPAWEAQMADPGRAGRGRPPGRRVGARRARSRAGCPSSGGGPGGRLGARALAVGALEEVARRGPGGGARCATLAERRPARDRRRRRRSPAPTATTCWIAAGAVRPAPRGQPGRAAHGGARSAPGRPRPPARPGGAARSCCSTTC